jgi:hypothetical protein
MALGPGERLAAISGVALALLMLFDWFGGSNAWQLKWTDLLLVAIAVLAVAVALAGGTGRQPAEAEAAPLALTVAGAVALGVMVTLVAESTGGTVPLVLSLAAAAGILCGGLLALTGAGRRAAATRSAVSRAPEERATRARQ